jgi:hypothetical protein
MLQRSLTIAKHSADLDSSNISWQRDLWSGYVNIGGVLEDENKLPEALASFRSAFAISDTLPSLDPSNAQSLTDATLSRYCIAKGLSETKESDLSEARRLVAQGLEMMTRRERQAAMDRYAEDTLSKLKEIASPLNPLSKE